MNTKKVIIPIIISVATLILLTVGVTYAYFNIGGTNNFGTKTITTSAESIGNVALSTGTNLTLNLSAKQMMDKGSDLAYYASSTGTTTTPTTEKIGTATVSGEGIYNCTYKLTMNDNSDSMYDVFQGMSTKSAGQIILTVNGIEYDFNTSGLFSKEISGTMYGLTSEEARDISASLKIVNKTSVDQSALAGSNITITFSATSFECNAVEDRLPSTYQEVEYLQSTGTQYIDTGYIPKINDVYKIKFSQTDIENNQVIFGSRTSGTYTDSLNQVYLNKSNSSASPNSLLFFSGTMSQNLLLTENNKIYELELNVNNGSFDNTSNKSLYLFSFNNMGSVTANSKSKMYVFKIYNNDILVRNMVPCYRKSDNVKGMYDLIENKFYTNAGTGTFEVGNNI